MVCLRARHFAVHGVSGATRGCRRGAIPGSVQICRHRSVYGIRPGPPAPVDLVPPEMERDRQVRRGWADLCTIDRRSLWLALAAVAAFCARTPPHQAPSMGMAATEPAQKPAPAPRATWLPCTTTRTATRPKESATHPVPDH